MLSSDEDDFEEYIENVKNSVRQSFAGILANLEARESETIQQLNSIRRQCLENKALKRICVRNLHISYDIESELLDRINCYGTIDLERLNFHDILLSEDNNINNSVGHHTNSLYPIRGHPENDIQSRKETEVGEARWVEAVKSRLNMGPCNVTINGLSTSNSPTEHLDPTSSNECVDKAFNDSNKCNDKLIKTESTEDKVKKDSVIKKEPTDDWLESIKTEIDAEPLGRDMMEHINIAGY